MINSDKSDSGRKMKIVMPDVAYDGIEALINFCYTGEIQLTIENVENCLKSAVLFEFSDIRDTCIMFMRENLQVNNIVKFKRTAEATKSQSLISVINDFINGNFVEISSSDDFVNSTSSEILEILGKDELKEVTEQQVHKAAIRWVEYNQSERASFLPEILMTIRLDYLSIHYLTNKVCEENLIRQSIECRDLLDEVKNRGVASLVDGTPELLNLSQESAEKK